MEGSGEVHAARVAASRGIKVGLAEGWDLGELASTEDVYLKNYTPILLILVTNSI